MVNVKKHNGDAGYIAERKNPFVPTEKVVIYIAAEQQIDADEKYIVVCDAHSVMVSVRNIPAARVAMKNPDSFCEECQQLRGAHDGN